MKTAGTEGESERAMTVILRSGYGKSVSSFNFQIRLSRASELNNNIMNEEKNIKRTLR